MQVDPRQVDVPVKVVGIALEGTPMTNLRCLSCGELLSVHQPENGWPDRMLGTCAHCHSWYLWDFEPDQNHAIMVSLPDHSYFLDAVREAHTRGDGA